MKTFFSHKEAFVKQKGSSDVKGSLWNQLDKKVILWHWSQTPFLEGHISAQFSSNPNQTHLIELIKLLMFTRNFQAGVIWCWLELYSAELWPSRN